jgi:hypothetical protein
LIPRLSSRQGSCGPILTENHSQEVKEMDKQLFVGMKISKQLQNGLDKPAPGTDRYFKQDNVEYLHIIHIGEERLIGRFLKDGFPVAEIDNVSRNVCSIIRLITGGQRIPEDSIHIYVG